MAEEKKRIDELVKLLKHYDYMYYVQNNPVASDEEYDRLYKELLNLEKEFPGYARTDSPTRKVGGEPLKGFAPARHKTPMLSIDNTYSKEELFEFDRRIKKAGEENPEYIVELKYDGVAVSLIYENGIFVRGITRGDGWRGDDITANLKTVKTLPLQIPYKKAIQARGEVYMRKDTFHKINANKKENQEPLFANPRNAAAGSLKLLNPKTVSERHLQLFVYQGFAENGWRTHMEVLEFLQETGFPVNPHIRRANDMQEALENCMQWQKKRNELPYNIDGMVIKVNSLALREKLGTTSKSPRWAVAYKFPAEQGETTLQKVIVQVGRTGTLTPVALLDPVQISGSRISRATLHNFDEIRRLGLKTGDRVFVEKGGEIIPKIVKPIPEKRTGKEQDISVPTICPECGGKVVKERDSVAITCPNVRCPAQVKERILHFSSRKAMDIEGLGEKWVNILVDKGILADYGDIYENISRKNLLELERMAEKSAENLIESIEKSKNRPFSNLVFALGIKHIGVNAAEILAEGFGSLDKLITADKEALSEIKEIGQVMAKSIEDFFRNRENLTVLEKLKKAGVRMSKTDTQQKTETRLAGLTFVITGIFSGYTRDSLTNAIKHAGGRVSGSVSSKTDFLVCGREPGSKLEKAKNLNIKIIGEEEFGKIVRGVKEQLFTAGTEKKDERT